MKTFEQYRGDSYSQNGEDGVIAEIMRRLGVTQGSCVEFGAWDGVHDSNTYHLVRQGWRAVAIEGDPEKFQDLLKTQALHPGQITAICRFVGLEGADSLDALLATTETPADFDLLSIDIDSVDWHVWSSLAQYRPKVVVIEINSSFPPGVRHIHQPGPIAGSSFTSTLELGRQKGYTLVCHTGNMIFVRDDLVEQLGLSQLERDYPESLFDQQWLSRSPRMVRIAKRLRQTLERMGLRGGREREVGGLSHSEAAPRPRGARRWRPRALAQLRAAREGARRGAGPGGEEDGRVPTAS